MPTICDTHILLFWAHEPERLSSPALQLGAALITADAKLRALPELDPGW
ncbi:hypothetical protein KBZ14_11580 [Synechococcus sp. HJ21-Hayes]|jgi:hypothetical protein|nr:MULTISPECIES: hypothetical protein [unclassified Synechococcus]MCP9832270.1 hypothetical protein [Synechococcus sp. JJ3a-Johnson]MCP9853499.1 hypothetical protein [Synechococcus sp. HJ21-Hayes]